MNPYDPPDRNLAQSEVVVTPNAKTNLRSLLIPSFVGGIVGSILLAPFTRGPGDPTGHGIAFGLAGLISLFGAIIFRTIKRSNKPNHPDA